MRIIFTIILIYFSSIIRWGYCIDAEEIVDKVKQTYNSIENFSAEFNQIFNWKLAGETQEFRGKLLLKEKDKFKIDTEDQLIISDGNSLWTYSKINNQVIIDNLTHADEVILPREIFFKFSQKYKPTLLREETFNESKCYVLLLTAKTEDVFIKEMKVWIDASLWFTLKIQQVDINQNTTTYILRNIITNKKIDDKEFVFQPPQNVEIIDMR